MSYYDALEAYAEMRGITCSQASRNYEQYAAGVEVQLSWEGRTYKVLYEVLPFKEVPQFAAGEVLAHLVSWYYAKRSPGMDGIVERWDAWRFERFAGGEEEIANLAEHIQMLAAEDLPEMSPE